MDARLPLSLSCAAALLRTPGQLSLPLSIALDDELH
jgi:hypothetical protein